MEFTLIRTELVGATPGELFLGEEHICYTLEDTVRPEGEFVKAVTAIPYGRYKMIISFSKRFKRQMIQIINIRGTNIQFGTHSIDAAGIRVHGGINVEDTEGCLLCGISRKPDHIGIYNCAPAVEKVFNLVQEADKTEEVYLNIIKANY